MRPAPIALAALLSTAPAAAHASPALDAFKAICVSAQAEAKAALAAAEAAGWRPIPPALFERLGEMKVQDPQGRMKAEGQGLMLAIVGHQPQTIAGQVVTMDACAIAAIPGDPTGLKGELAAWAAVPETPALSNAQRTGYAFRDEGGRHVPVNAGEGQAALDAGHLNLVFAGGQAQTALVVLAVPVQKSPN